MIAGVLLAALLQAGSYERAPLASTDFVWVERPTSADIGKFYPNSTARPVERLVVIECLVGREGWLQRCRVYQAPPTDNGEITASLGIAGRFRVSPRTKSGESTAGRKVRIPILWKLPD